MRLDRDREGATNSGPISVDGKGAGSHFFIDPDAAECQSGEVDI